MDPKNNRNKNIKIKSFLFFLGMAVILWFLTKFSGEIKVNVQADILYQDIPETVLLSNQNEKHLTMDVTANGFQMLLYALRDAQLPIAITPYYQEGDSIVHLSELELAGIVKRQLGVGQVANISPATLQIRLDRSVQKKVPIRLSGKLGYKEGYRSLNGPILIPDSVVLHGPSELVKTLDSISTQTFNRKNIDASFQEELTLDLPNDSRLQVHPKAIVIQLDVAEFSQKTVQVPIQLINVPENTNVKMIPEVIQLKFEVTVEDFNNVDASSFQVVCDFSDKISEGHFMIPRITYKPKEVFRVELETKKVEYLIFK